VAGRTIQQARQELFEQSKVFRRVFETEDGKAVLAILEARFGVGQAVRPSSGAAVDPYQLAINHGARQPMEWVRELLRFGMREEERHG
jgi:hypothetical protein